MLRTSIVSRFLRTVRTIQNRLITVDIYRIWASPVQQSAPYLNNPLLDGVVVNPPPSNADATDGDEAGTRASYSFSYKVGRQTLCRIELRSTLGYRRATLDLLPNEAKLLYVITTAQFRGKGIAPFLIQHVTSEMRKFHYDTLYARIWHSNYSSEHAFKKAGWQRTGTVCFIHSPIIPLPLPGQRMLRLSFFTRRSTKLVGRHLPAFQCSIQPLVKRQ